MRKKTRASRAAVDPTRLLSELQSFDETVRASAVGSLCPCRVGWEMFEQHMGIVARLQKDPSRRVRARALHVLEDAGELQSGAYPTHRREAVDEMLRTKRRSRLRLDDEEVVARQKAKGKGRGRGRVVGQ